MIMNLIFAADDFPIALTWLFLAMVAFSGLLVMVLASGSKRSSETERPIPERRREESKSSKPSPKSHGLLANAIGANILLLGGSVVFVLLAYACVFFQGVYDRQHPKQTGPVTWWAEVITTDDHIRTLYKVVRMKDMELPHRWHFKLVSPYVDPNDWESQTRKPTDCLWDTDGSDNEHPNNNALHGIWRNEVKVADGIYVTDRDEGFKDTNYPEGIRYPTWELHPSGLNDGYWVGTLQSGVKQDLMHKFRMWATRP
jgi:hypothetical protein